MTLDLLSRFPETGSDVVELECLADECDGRMIVDDSLATRLGIECPVPGCGCEVTVA